MPRGGTHRRYCPLARARSGVDELSPPGAHRGGTLSAPPVGANRRAPGRAQALADPDYRLFLAALTTSGLGSQMVQVAIGWQVYAIHRSAFDLGLIGLVEFVPLLALALPAGHLADRFSRRNLMATSLALEALTTGLLVLVSLEASGSLWPFLTLAAAIGAAAALGAPPQRALPASLIPIDLIANAMALRSSAFQASVVVGPAVGGLLFAIGPVVPYAAATGLVVGGLACTLALREPERTVPASPGLDSILAGIRFIRSARVILGAITLDLFAVLFGGAIALAPLFARTILHTGPLGLGLLRSAPAVGALAAGLLLARRPLRRDAGRTLLLVVGAFGVCMIAFGLSRSLPISLAVLAVSGFVDMISVNIRSTTVALATPDALRGRVLAVENVFISASNELGAFESGAAAALLGAVVSVVAGGAVTIGLALGWKWLFPDLARVGRLEELAPEPVGAGPEAM